MPSTSSAAVAGDSPLASLHNFSLLSYEVQGRIVNTACLLRMNDVSTGPAVLLDASTATSLALVSKTFNAMAVQTLYAHIRITRPSELRLLVASIVERPHFATLIRSLHIGPSDRLPYEWHPFHTGRLLRAFDADGEQQDRYGEWSSINWRSDDSVTSAHSTGIPPAIHAIKHVTGTVDGWLNITSEGQEGWPRRGPGGPVRLGQLSDTPPAWQPFRSGLPTVSERSQSSTCIALYHPRADCGLAYRTSGGSVFSKLAPSWRCTRSNLQSTRIGSGAFGISQTSASLG